VSSLIPAAAAAAPVAAGWSAHTVWLRRRLQAARRDPLSGLMGRAGFEHAAARILRRHGAAVVVIDLDGFKQVNDTFGHAAGDAVIAATGERLRARDLLVCGRLGGDEFAVVAPCGGAPGLRMFLARLHMALCAPVPYGETPGGLLFVGASVGGVLAPAGTGLSVALRVADEAMYGVKRSGGGPAAVYGLDPACRTVNGRRDGRHGTGSEPEAGGAA
jgi:diguanylate cyclase (GGDEF)-like protein